MFALIETSIPELIAHILLKKKSLSLQNAGGSGCVLKNAAQNCLKPRFLKTGLKDKRSSRVRSNGALAQVLSPVFDRCNRIFIIIIIIST